MCIEIKKAEIKDFLKISELDRKAWGHNKDAQFVPDGEHVWRLWVEYAIVYCAFDNEHIIGVILAFPSTDPFQYLLHKIFIDYNYRNKGIGQMLFSILCDKLDELNAECSLTTSSGNNRMLEICSKFSFSEKIFVKSYYRETEDRYFLTRKQKK